MRLFNGSLFFLILSCAMIVGCQRHSGDLSKASFDDPAVAKMIQNHREILAEMKALGGKGMSSAEQAAKFKKLMQNPGMNRRITSTNMSSGDRAKFMAYMMEANKEMMKFGR